MCIRDSLIDVEIFTGDDTVRSILAAAHRANVPVIASNHHFHETPAQETLLEILTKMDQMGADILKIAVMPQSRKDVLTLLSATEEMDLRTAKPLITMSMGPVGMISRLCEMCIRDRSHIPFRIYNPICTHPPVPQPALVLNS